MKKIFFFLMFCCLMLGAFAQTPGTGTSGSSSSGTPSLGGTLQQTTSKDSTLVSPSSDGSTTWTAPIGAYQITNITITGDGGNGGKGAEKKKTNLAGGKGGGGGLITDNEHHTLSSSSARSLKYEYISGVNGYRKVTFTSVNEYTAFNGKNGTDASSSGSSGSSGVDGDCGVCSISIPSDNVDLDTCGANNGGNGGEGKDASGELGGLGKVRITYNILQIPVVIVKEGSEGNTTIFYYDQIGHALTAADSAGVAGFYYDANFTNPVDGASPCLAEKDSTVRLYAKFPLTVKVDSTNSKLVLDCKGVATGKITLAAAGSTGSYSYSIDGETYQDGNVFENLAAGNYKLYAATANDTTTVQVEIKEPTAVTVALSENGITRPCFEQANGSFTVVATGGTGSTYTYSEENNGPNENGSFSNLAAGLYKITAKDANGCESDTLKVTVEQLPQVTIEKTGETKISFMGKRDGAFTVSATGGAGTSYTYSFNGGNYYAVNADTTGCGAGTYSCYAKDSQGCQSEVLKVTLTDVYPMAYVKKNTMDTIGTNTLKAAVDSLNKYEGGTVLAYSDEELTQTVIVNSDIQILARGADVTFSRGDTMKANTSVLIRVNGNNKLTIGNAPTDDYEIVFDGGNFAPNSYFAGIVENNGTLTLAGKVSMRDNKAGWKITDGGGSAILNKDSLSISGQVKFENNYSSQNGGAIQNTENSRMNISGKVEFINNESNTRGGALNLKEGSKTNIEEAADVKFEGNKSAAGGAINVAFGATLSIDGITHFAKNMAHKGATLVNGGTTNINGNIVVKGDTSYNSGVITSSGTLNIRQGEITENVLYIDSADYNNGTIVVEHNSTVLVGGNIHDNVFINRTSDELYPLPASVVITSSGSQTVTLGGDVIVDTMTLVIAGDFNQQVVLNSNLTVVNENNPIVLQLDSLDKQVLKQSWVTGATDNGSVNNLPRIAANYMKFKPTADTLTINRKGWVVRKPEISVDGIYLLQAGTLYEDYGITTATGNVDVDKIYVEYTQTVDACGYDVDDLNINRTLSDSTIIEMNVTYGDATSMVRQKIDAQVNGQYAFTVPFNSDLWDAKPTAGSLVSGMYKVEIDTLVVHTLGISAGTEKTLDKNVNIPTFNVDTLNFLLAGTMFSDYHYCGVGAATNDGDGNDVVPGDEIYVQYTRSGAIDTAYITVEVTGNGQTVTYKENTPANTQFSAGCGSFRSFLDNTGIGQFEPNALQLVDDSTYTCNVNIHVKAVGDPYFAIANKTFTYKHDIDRKAIFALDTAEDRNEKYNNIGIVLNNYDDSLALTYPSAFSVAKAQELGMIDNTDKCVYVVLTADPVDETIRVESANQAKNLLADVALNSSNYSTAGYGIQDGKLLMAVKVSESVAENAVVVPAINFAMDSVLRWCSVIGANTGVNNPYHTYRTYYKVSGETAHDTSVVAYNQMSYRKTGVSGVKLHNSSGQASFMYHPEDYTVWAAQDATPGLNLDNKVWLALYVAAPNENIKQVYSHPATNTPSGEVSRIVALEDNLENRVTTTQAVNYYPVGTCADYANKDYTFYTNDIAYENNYLYWFDENGKLLSVQHFNAAVKAAPQYTVNFNFHGGGATCNDPYSDTFADTAYVFGRPIVRPDDPFKCGHLFMDWRHGVDPFTVDSFKNIRAGIAEGTGAAVAAEPFGIRSNLVLDAAWKYFVTIEGLRDTAVVANYSLCEINTRDYVVEPTEAKRPYIYTFHKDYLGKYYRDYIPGKNGNCDVKFGDSVYLENPKILPVGQTSQVTWTVTDMCGTPFTLTQNVNVMFPPCGADNYNPAESAYVRETNNHGSLDGEYLASIDGKDDYRTVRIGCNCWLKENLQNENYAGGSSIAIAKAYLNDETKVPEFGRLYTWYSAVNVSEGEDNTQPATANETITFSQTSNTYSRDYVQGICPNGWHIPSIDEYNNLKDVVGNANAVKAVGSNYWLGYQDATDAAGFTGIPAGYYDHSTDKYFNILGKAYFWSTENYSVKALPCSLLYGCPEILFSEQNKFYGVSVRCVRNIQISYEEQE